MSQSRWRDLLFGNGAVTRTVEVKVTIPQDVDEWTVIENLSRSAVSVCRMLREDTPGLRFEVAVVGALKKIQLETER